MRSVKSAHKPGAGFTLVEVVVALVILAGALAAVLPRYGNALRLGAGASDQRAALLAAQSILAEIAVRPRPDAGPLSGRLDGDLTWTAAVRPLPLEAEAGRVLLPPFEVTVEVATPAVRPVASLTTITLGRP